MPSPEDPRAHALPARRVLRRFRDGIASSRESVARNGRQALPALAASIVAAAITAVVLGALSADALRVSAIFIALLAVALGLGTDRWILAIGALVITWWLAAVLVRFLPDALNPNPSVAQAIGGAAVFNTPYRGPQIAAVLSVALPTLVAFAAVVLSRITSIAPFGWNHPEQAHSVREARTSVTRTSASVGRVLPLGIGAAVVLFTIFPDLKTILHGAGTKLPYDWDLSNISAWAGLVQFGLVPMKDFFYPYGFQWIFGVGTEGPIYLWLVQGATLALMAWSLWRLTGASTWRVIACLLAVVIIGTWPQSVWRYLPAVAVTTTYAALGPGRHHRFTRGHVVFFLACLLAGLLGADLLGYGLVGAVLVFAGEFVSVGAERRPRRLAVALALDAAPVLLAVVVILLVWVATGTFAGNVRFFAGFSAVSAQSAPNEQEFGPLGNMVLEPATYSLWAVIPALMTAAGLLWARFRPPDMTSPAGLLLGAAGISLGMVLKFLVRPIDDQVLIAPVVALTWTAILTWNSHSAVRAAASAAAVAGLLVFLGQGGAESPESYLRTAVNAPKRAVRTVSALLDSSLRARAARDAVDPSRFTTWPDFAVTTDYAVTMRRSPVPPFAIVGDSQMTYVLLRQKPPYQLDMYDASQIAEQRVLVNELVRRRPPYLIWREDFDQDGVPYDVRTPLVFTYMVANYLPVRSFVNPIVDILRRRPAGAPVATDFWRSRLGTMEDLGYIPSFSTAADSPTCAAGPDCVPYVIVHGHARRSGATIAFDVTGNGRTYRVRMWSRRGVDVYPVRLDRLWFWPLLGPKPRFAAATPGYAALAEGLRSGGNLY